MSRDKFYQSKKLILQSGIQNHIDNMGYGFCGEYYQHGCNNIKCIHKNITNVRKPKQPKLTAKM